MVLQDLAHLFLFGLKKEDFLLKFMLNGVGVCPIRSVYVIPVKIKDTQFKFFYSR